MPNDGSPSPTPEALADLVARYDAIGGISPLAKLTEDQRDGLQAALDEIEPDTYHVTLGLKHADPKVEVASAELAAAGFSKLIGLVPATIGPYVVAKLGASMARRVFMSSRVFGATEAERLGLIARIGAADDLDALVEAEVVPYLSCAPGAVATAKRHLLALAPAIDDEVIAMSAEVLVGRWQDGEAAEGIAAFFEKRKPRWAKG